MTGDCDHVSPSVLSHGPMYLPSFLLSPSLLLGDTRRALDVDVDDRKPTVDDNNV